MEMNVAVIGAGGFIGGHLCHKLVSRPGVNLARYGRKNTVAAGFSPYDPDDKVALRRLREDADVIYYLASETIPSSSWLDPFLDIENNLKPFLRLLDDAGPSRLKKVVFISSAGTIYGTTSGKVKEDADKRPFSPYGIVKLAMENYLEYFHRRYGLNYDIYRVSNVYGSGQNTGKGLGIINTFLEKIIRGEEIVVFGDGSATRNYVYVEDVAEMLLYSLGSLDKSGVYNLSSDSTVSINELIRVIRSTVKEDFKVRTEAGRGSDNAFIDLDNSSLKKLHPDFKFTGLPEGIALTYQSLKTVQSKRNV